MLYECNKRLSCLYTYSLILFYFILIAGFIKSFYLYVKKRDCKLLITSLF